jgi:hypothetical protein
MRLQRRLLAGGLVLTIVGFVVIPLLLLALPVVITALVLMLKNFRRDRRWFEEYKAARHRALVELLTQASG